jgi:excisionase family DNA binding protein
MQEALEAASAAPDLLTIPQVAQHLGVCRAHVYKLINTMGLPVIRLGHRVFIHKNTLIRWLVEQEQSSSPS